MFPPILPQLDLDFRTLWLACWQVYLYGLGLLAAGLLPFKPTKARQLAHRVLSLALALLWGWLAYAAWIFNPAHAVFWSALAVLEFLLLLGLGTVWGGLRFPVRNGSWALFGTALCVYSLIAFPILSVVLESGKPGLGAPFPVVLFTCGVLFFARGWIASLALVPPIIWAISGGPESADSVEIWGLRVALLAGTWFALLPPELRGGGERRVFPGAGYQFAYRGQGLFGYGIWILVLTTLFVFFISGGPFSDETQPGSLNINLALLSALGIALWLAFPAWQSLWFRSVAWRAARAWGRTRGAWKWVAFLLAVALLALSWRGQEAERQATGSGQTSSTGGSAVSAQGQPENKKDENKKDGWLAFLEQEIKTSWITLKLSTLLLLVFLTLALLWLVQLAYRARKRLVIGTFTDYSGAVLLKDFIPGLGPRLQNELARISELYKTIEEARPPQGSPVIEVTPSVHDVGDILREAAGTDPIKIGPIHIPTNFLLKFAGWLVSGPRVSGALHKVDQDFALTAELSGGGLAGNWLVESSKLTEEERRLPEQAVIHKLIEELAFRVVARLVSNGSPRWRAVRCFTEGLRFYRETQRKDKDKNRNLREAESCLIQALNDDNKFAQCHYNLGVVYRQLGELGAAESAFRQALAEDPDNYEAYYGLAETFVMAKSYAKAVWFCEAALSVGPKDPRAWDLKAFAERRYVQELCGLEPPKSLSAGHAAWKDILEMREISVALAWRALCGRELRGEPSINQKDTAFLCTLNLAIVLVRTTKYDEALRLFQQAAWLAPHDYALRLNEGRSLFWRKDQKGGQNNPVTALDDARNVLEGVFDGGLEIQDRGFLWSTVAYVFSRSAQHQEGDYRQKAYGNAARIAHNRFLDLASGASPKDLKKIIDFTLEQSPSKEKSR